MLRSELKFWKPGSYLYIFFSFLALKAFFIQFSLTQQGLCDVTPEGYHHLTRMLMNLANGRVVIVLEVLYVFYTVQCVEEMVQPDAIKHLHQFFLGIK